MTETEIGRGSFGACFLAKYGSRTASKHEARMTARLSHPNTVCFMGIVKRQSRIDIVTIFYNVNGERMHLGDIPVENTSINWTRLLSGLCRGIHLYDKVKILHNDIKSNNVVLDGHSLAEAEAVLVDFGKARDQSSPKSYQKPADTKRFKHLAPELGQLNGKQSKKTDIYSLEFLVRELKYKFVIFPKIFFNLYRSCLRCNSSQRPTINELCEQLECANN